MNEIMHGSQPDFSERWNYFIHNKKNRSFAACQSTLFHYIMHGLAKQESKQGPINFCLYFFEPYSNLNLISKPTTYSNINS